MKLLHTRDKIVSILIELLLRFVASREYRKFYRNIIILGLEIHKGITVAIQMQDRLEREERSKVSSGNGNH